MFGVASRLLVLLLAWPGLASAQPISGRPHCPQCEIVVSERLALGAVTDEAGPAGLSWVALGLSDGAFHVVSIQLPAVGVLVYASDGGFVGPLARRGQGPGELGLPSRLASSPNGEVFVYDLAGSSVHVFGSHRAFRRMFRGVVPPEVAVVIGDTILVVLAGSARSREVPDREVVVYDARSGTAIRGIGPQSDLRPDRSSTVTHVAGSSDESIWLVRAGDRLIERWSLQGERIASIEWSADWLRSARPGAADDRGARLLHVWEDSRTGLLWVTSTVRDPDYRPPPEGLPARGPLPSGYLDPRQVNARLNTVISVIDLDRGEAVAHLEIDEHVHQFLVDGRVTVMREADNGHQWIEVLRLELRGYPDHSRSDLRE